jgi:heterotetrameric sarcosine oxidase gamma subunit
MTALAFLQPDAPSDAVPARSPMAHEAAAVGARFEARGGWQVAVDFGDAAAEARACAETVVWADVSHLGALELQGASGALATLPGAPALELGTATLAEGAWWCPVTTERVLVVGETSADDSSIAALRDRLNGTASVHVLDATTTHGALVIAGPQARETIARFCALDLRPNATPVASFRPGSVARTPGHLLCEAPDRYRLLFGAAYGRYLWTVVADAGGHLGGRAAGIDAVVASGSEPAGVQAHA